MLERWRMRLARWLVGEFFRYPESGTWLVNYDEATKMMFAIRVSEWSGTLTTQVPPLDETLPYGYSANTTSGQFYGKFN